MAQVVKAVIHNVDSGDDIEVMFNPKEYILSRKSPWAEAHGIGTDLPDVTFSSGNRRSLYMELFFDTSDTESAGVMDVSDSTKQIEALMAVDPSFENADGSKGRPPYLIFQWGGFSFNCVLENLVQRFTRFSADGVPTRAILRVVFKEIKASSGAAPTTGGFGL